METSLSSEELVAQVRAIGAGVLATVDPSGRPEAAYVGVAVTEAGDLLVDSLANARKVTNLLRNPAAAVVVTGPDQRSLQIEGVARVLQGPERDIAAQVYEQVFPGSRVRDPDFALVEITPTWNRLYAVSD